MATIYDFPTNYEEKLKDIDELLAKNYIDQAICTLEDWLETCGSVTDEGQKEIRKKLLSCYLFKREYESCQELVLQLKELRCLDLGIAAYDIVVSLLQNQQQEANEKQTHYQQQLKLNSFAYQNLVELVYQLKNFYEEEWSKDAEKKFKALVSAKSYEQILFVLSDLEKIAAEYFHRYETSLKCFFDNEHSPALKTMLFELLSRKGLKLEVEFRGEKESKKLETTRESLELFYDAISLAQKDLIRLNLDEATKALLEQHIIMFYQSVFPFFEKIDKKVVIQQLGRQCGGVALETLIKEEFKEQSDSTHELVTVHKINEYVLSLSLLR